MNFYPNYYPNIYQQNYPSPQFLMQNQQVNPQPSAPALNGKIVDSEEVARATEVPIGGYGVFPKADLSEIYIKSWNNNGTTSVITFKPIINSTQSQEMIPQDTVISQVFDKLQQLEIKINEIIESKQNTSEIKKEVNLNGY